MRKLLTSLEAAFSAIPGPSTPSGPYRKSARATDPEAQADLLNPVLLALRGLDQPPREGDSYARDRLRIASEIMQQLGWAIEETPRSLNGESARAPASERSEDQVKQTCVELQAYLDLFAEEKERQAAQAQQQARPVNGRVLRNPVLAALGGSHI